MDGGLGGAVGLGIRQHVGVALLDDTVNSAAPCRLPGLPFNSPQRMRERERAMRGKGRKGHGD